MREVVRIDRRSTTQDAVGEPLLSWVPFTPLLRAAIERTPGREIWASSERQGRVPTVFRLRWRDGVLPAMRLVSGDRVFNIVSAIDPDGMRAELVITAEELVEETP